MRKSKDDKVAGAGVHNSVINSLFAQLPEMSLIGNEEVVIEGSKGVVEYSEETIRINTNLGLVCFFGRGLNLKCISQTQLIINGFITKLEFIV